jgi:hypothetical protein
VVVEELFTVLDIASSYALIGWSDCGAEAIAKFSCLVFF